MNLRSLPEKKKRGRPENTYKLTFKGYLYVCLGQTSVDIEVFFKNLEEFAEKHTKKGDVPAIIFNGNGGSFVGVKLSESSN